MKYLINLLFLLETCNIAWSMYLPSSNGQQQQLVQQNIIQQNLIHHSALQQNLMQQILLIENIKKLQQQLYVLQERHVQGQSNRASVIDDFEYIPTVHGYRYSYKLPDATRREEHVYITGLHTDGNPLLNSQPTPLMAVDADSRFRMKVKNRKLSPGSLRALAG